MLKPSPKSEQLPQRNAFCHLPFSKFKVNCEGYATMCCFQTYNCLGNVLTEGFEKIWFGELANEIRAETAAGKLHALCNNENCPFFWHSQKTSGSKNHSGLPTQLEIDLPNTHCNIGGENPNSNNPACVMCWRDAPDFIKQTDRLREVCEAIKPYMGNVWTAHIQGIAEPFWKDRIFETVELLGFSKQINLSTTTNGTLLTTERRAKWFLFPHSCLTFSMDAGTPETYKKIRRLNIYERVVENLIACGKERKSNQRLRIHNNVNTINVGEVELMVDVAKQAKVDEIEFNPTGGGFDFCVNESNVGLFRDAQKKIVRRGQQLGVKTKFMRPLTLDFKL